MAAVVFDQADAQGPVGGGLQPAVDRRGDLEAVADGGFSEAGDDLEPHELGDIGRLDVIQRGEPAGGDGLLGGLGGGLLVDIAQLRHAPEHVGAAVLGGLGVAHGVVARGQLDDAGERCGLGHRQLGERLAVEGLGGGGNAIAALAEEDHVQVGGEDLFLREIALHPVGEEHLGELAAQRLVEREEHVARGLLGDRAAALAGVGGGHVHHQRAGHAHPVEAGVLEEPVVLGGEHGLADHLGDLVEGHRDASLLADLGDEAAGPGIDPQGHRQLDLVHGLGRGQRGGDVNVGAGQRKSPAQQRSGQANQGKTDPSGDHGLHEMDIPGLLPSTGRAQFHCLGDIEQCLRHDRNM